MVRKARPKLTKMVRLKGNLPRVSQSPTDPEFVQNPYPFYERARALGSIVWWDEYDLPAAVSFSAISTLLRDRRLGREPIEPVSVPDHTADFYAIEAHSMLELEPPRHTRLRGLVLRAFTQRRVAALGPEIETLCHELIDAFPDAPFDLITHYAQDIPVRIIARLLGVPESISPDLLRWSNAMVGMYQARRTRQDEEAAAQSAAEFAAFIRGYARERSNSPADDLITHLLAAEEDGQKLSTVELISTCILLLNAGHEATVHSIGNAVKTLIENRVVPDSESNMANMVEELLRFDPPLHMFTRYVYDDIAVDGVTFQRGDQVACLLAAGNRDPQVWDMPDQFDAARPIQTNASFGAGIHFCVGAPLARLELSIALRTLFQRCPQLRLAQSPDYANLYHFHGLKALWLSKS